MINAKKEIGRVYFGLGIEDQAQRFGWKTVYFYFFKLIARNPEGEEMKRGRDYKGFILKKNLTINFGFQKSWANKNKKRCQNCGGFCYEENVGTVVGANFPPIQLCANCIGKPALHRNFLTEKGEKYPI